MITLFSLLIVVAYVVISIAVTVVVARKKNARAAGFVAAALFLLGTWDVILGRAALWYSCEFKRVAVLPTQKIPLGTQFIDKHGRVDWNLVDRETQYSFKYSTTTIADWLGFEERNATVIDRKAGQTIARISHFAVKNGWLEQFANPGMTSCSADGVHPESTFTLQTAVNSTTK